MTHSVLDDIVNPSDILFARLRRDVRVNLALTLHQGTLVYRSSLHPADTRPKIRVLGLDWDTRVDIADLELQPGLGLILAQFLARVDMDYYSLSEAAEFRYQLERAMGTITLPKDLRDLVYDLARLMSFNPSDGTTSLREFVIAYDQAMKENALASRPEVFPWRLHQ